MARTPARSPGGSPFSGAGRPPGIIIVLIAATVVASIVGAVGYRHGFPVVEWAALIPQLVRRGQLWRLFTWPFFELSPLALGFACFFGMYMFGRDLAYRWGPVRFVAAYLGGAALIGGVVVALSLVFPAMASLPHVGTWPLQEAIIILWASYFPSRQINFYFLFPLNGQRLILLTIAGTVLFAIFEGVDRFIPHFVAEALALAFVNMPSARSLWIERKLRSMEKRRATHLKAVPRDDRPPSGDQPRGGRWLN